MEKLISLNFQEIVDEIVRQKKEKKIKKTIPTKKQHSPTPKRKKPVLQKNDQVKTINPPPLINEKEIICGNHLEKFKTTNDFNDLRKRIPINENHYYEIRGNLQQLSEIKFDKVTIFFENLGGSVSNIIKKYSSSEYLTLGCVAWLSSPEIISALLESENVQIIVQKELRIKEKNYYSNYEGLGELYKKIKCGLPLNSFIEPIKLLRGEKKVDAVRCIGVCDGIDRTNTPRMHHKFLVFCKINRDMNGNVIDYYPVALWNGSYNFTKNGSRSLENGTFYSDESGKNPYFWGFLDEHHKLFCNSESIDWKTSHPNPDYRICIK
jgi:hypothetical protein